MYNDYQQILALPGRLAFSSSAKLHSPTHAVALFQSERWKKKKKEKKKINANFHITQIKNAFIKREHLQYQREGKKEGVILHSGPIDGIGRCEMQSISVSHTRRQQVCTVWRYGLVKPGTRKKIILCKITWKQNRKHSHKDAAITSFTTDVNIFWKCFFFFFF